MGSVLEVTAPIYLLIAAGFASVRSGWMAAGDMRVLGRFVAQFCVPALLFRAISRQPIKDVLHGDYLVVYAAGSLLALTAVTLFARLARGREMAIFAGLLCSALGLVLPSVLERTVTLAAAAAPPTALFVIGGSLVGLRLAGIRGDLALVAGGKLLLHPLAVLACVWLLPPTEPALRAAAVLFAAMPMLSIYPVLAQKHGHERFCAAALLAATVVSFVTISVLIATLPSAWLAAK